MNNARAAAIRSIAAREILNSRGDPTIEVEIVLNDDTRGSASVPSGASTGRHEAHELRGGDPTRFAGKGVERAVANVSNDIAACIHGEQATAQARIDQLLVELDGSANLAKLRPGEDVAIALDVAASELYRARVYELPVAGLCMSGPEMIAMLVELA